MKYPDALIDTSEGKSKFLTDLFNALHEEAQGKVDDMPDNWDGHELRQYVADLAKECVWKGTMSRDRKNAYHLTVLEHHL